MGNGMEIARRWLTGGAALGALAGLAACQQGGEAPANGASAANGTEATAAAPAPRSTAAADSMEAWLTGSWSYEDSCATDFVVHYEADHSLNNFEDVGTWSIEGDMVTETITERHEMGEEGVEKINPPEIRKYKATRIDATHGELLFEGKKIPILRC